MTRLTRSEDCSEIKVDSLYLAWSVMKWNLEGEIREYNIDKSELCSHTETSVSLFIPSSNSKSFIDKNHGLFALQNHFNGKSVW